MHRYCAARSINIDWTSRSLAVISFGKIKRGENLDSYLEFSSLKVSSRWHAKSQKDFSWTSALNYFAKVTSFLFGVSSIRLMERKSRTERIEIERLNDQQLHDTFIGPFVFAISRFVSWFSSISLNWTSEKEI